jgi:hypothetical protein
MWLWIGSYSSYKSGYSVATERTKDMLIDKNLESPVDALCMIHSYFLILFIHTLEG